MDMKRANASAREVTGSGVAGLLAHDEVHVERRAAELAAVGTDLDPVATDLLEPHALEVGHDVRGRRRRWHLDPQAWRLGERVASGGAHDLDAQLVRARVGLEDGDDEASAMGRGQARDVDLAEYPDRADLPVLRGERV